MIIKTLQDTSVSVIHQSFQKAFTGYFVTLDPREEIHVSRWRSAGVDFSLSYGAFVDDELVGFILHAPKGTNVFNVGTGVIAEHRGKRVVDRIYAVALKELKAKGFASSELEVITINQPAIRAYERVGFEIKRELACFKGVVKDLPSDQLPQYLVRDPEFTEEMRNMITHPFSFEQSETAVTRAPFTHQQHELRNNHGLLAYGIFHPGVTAFAQICAKKHFNENAMKLLSRMDLSGKLVKFNNVDLNNLDLINFLKEIGLEHYISQYEMRRVL